MIITLNELLGKINKTVVYLPLNLNPIRVTKEELLKIVSEKNRFIYLDNEIVDRVDVYNDLNELSVDTFVGSVLF